MEVVRYIITPHSSWCTPWQADTLGGQLYALCARLHGPDLLREALLEPALRGEPAFVLSDGLPGNLIPVPAVVRTQDRPVVQRRQIRAARWTTDQGLQQLMEGGLPEHDALFTDAQVFHQVLRVRNTLDRTTQGTPDQGGLWNTTETWLVGGFTTLTVHARVQPAARTLLDGLFHELARVGYGADASAGYGQFDLAVEDGRPVNRTASDGCMALGTFQPAPHDPTQGFWEGFIKYGKLGMDVGQGQVFKRPQWMLRPGACFVGGGQGAMLGRAIPTSDLLPSKTAAALAERDIRPLQPAFTISMPIPWHNPSY